MGRGGVKTGGCQVPFDVETEDLDTFWIRDESLEDSANLLEPDVILEEMIEDLESVLAQLRELQRTWGRILCPDRESNSIRYLV